jgi:hypothetical protein
MVYNSQNYWVIGLCPSSGILETIKLNISETASVSVLRLRRRWHLLCWVLTSVSEDGNKSGSKTLCFLGSRIPEHEPSLTTQ